MKPADLVNVLGHNHTNHPLAASTQRNISNVYRQQGKFAQALELGGNVRAADRGILGHEHPRVANNLLGLACLHSASGTYSEALLDMEEVVKAGLQSLAGVRRFIESDRMLDAIRSDLRFTALPLHWRQGVQSQTSWKRPRPVKASLSFTTCTAARPRAHTQVPARVHIHMAACTPRCDCYSP